jgi:serine/threonine protein phosphatase PrpC
MAFLGSAAASDSSAAVPSPSFAARAKSSALSDGSRPRPDSLSGHLPAWVRSRSGTSASGETTQRLRIAHAAFFALATQTAAYKNENDDATFLERLADGMIIAGLFDGVTIPKRNNRSGWAVAAFIRERLRATLVETDGRRPVVETVLSNAMEESVAVLEKLGGGAATTATVVVAAPMPTREWRVYVINAGNSRATAFRTDGTIEPITRIKPPGTPFAAVNTLTRGYTYRLEITKQTVGAGTLLLLTSDGVHDHVPDTRIWADLGRAVESTLSEPGPWRSAGAIERLARGFTESVVERATGAQGNERSDDTTAMALVIGDPSQELAEKRPL